MIEKTIEIKLVIESQGDEVICRIITDFYQQECLDIRTKLFIHYLRQKLAELINPLMTTVDELAILHEYLFKHQLTYDKPATHSLQFLPLLQEDNTKHKDFSIYEVLLLIILCIFLWVALSILS